METNAICRLHFLCIHCNSFVPRDCLFDFRNVYFYCDARPKRKPSGDASKSELHRENIKCDFDEFSIPIGGLEYPRIALPSD